MYIKRIYECIHIKMYLRWVRDNAGYLTPWEGRLKRIESQFGRSVMMMMVMIVMTMMMLSMMTMMIMLRLPLWKFYIKCIELTTFSSFHLSPADPMSS